MRALHDVFSRLLSVDRYCGPALDTITSTGTAIGAALVATTIAPGDSFQIKNQDLTKKVMLLTFWVDNQVAGMVRIRSPKLHDNVEAIRSRVQIGVLEPLLPLGVAQKLWPQDTEIVELAGSAVAGDVESVVQLLYYEDLPGVSARFIDEKALAARMQHVLCVRNAIVLSGAAGYSGAAAINATVDFLKANTDYAVLGFTTDIETAAVCLRGPDTGNLRVSAPGEPGLWHHLTGWFRLLTVAFGMPLIPVINSANKGGTLIDCVGDENAGTVNVTTWLAELSK